MEGSGSVLIITDPDPDPGGPIRNTEDQYYIADLDPGFNFFSSMLILIHFVSRDFTE
jgi:hypothetical protein